MIVNHTKASVNQQTDQILKILWNSEYKIAHFISTKSSEILNLKNIKYLFGPTVYRVRLPRAILSWY